MGIKQAVEMKGSAGNYATNTNASNAKIGILCKTCDEAMGKFAENEIQFREFYDFAESKPSKSTYKYAMVHSFRHMVLHRFTALYGVNWKIFDHLRNYLLAQLKVQHQILFEFETLKPMFWQFSMPQRVILYDITITLKRINLQPDTLLAFLYLNSDVIFHRNTSSATIRLGAKLFVFSTRDLLPEKFKYFEESPANVIAESNDGYDASSKPISFFEEMYHKNGNKPIPSDEKEIWQNIQLKNIICDEFITKVTRIGNITKLDVNRYVHKGDIMIGKDTAGYLEKSDENLLTLTHIKQSMELYFQNYVEKSIN